MTFRSKARRAGWLLVVAAFAFGLFSAVRPSQANAYGLISTRFIKMSSSIGDANNVMYNIGFNTASAINLTTIAIHFCANDPIIGDTCTAPTNFSANVGTLTFNSWSATNGVTQMTINTTTTATPNVLILTRSAGNVPAGTNFNFELGNGTTNGFHNPQAPNVTFFARITLFASGSTVDFSSDTAAKTTENAATDAGGVAMSTANALAVTAKVQEALKFCVYTAANCAGGGNTINLGDSNGVLADTTLPYTNATPMIELSSNALGGVIVRMKGDTLTSGTFTITPSGQAVSTNQCIQDSTSSSVEQFGVRIVSYGAGQVAPDLATHVDDFGTDAGCNAGYHKFVVANTNTTYGEPFIKTAGATDDSISNFELMAKAANTTEAGVYKTTLQFIATATY